MGNETPKASLFTKELEILQQAKVNLHSGKYLNNQLLPLYQELVDNYEKLIKITTKIFKISDIQGKSLKSQEQEIQRINKHLKQIDTSRRQLISDISHELGTPMTSIQGYIKGMLDGVLDKETRYLQLVYDKLLTIDRLVEDLFELSKLEANQIAFQFEFVEISELWQIVSQRFQFEIENNGYRFVVDPVKSLASKEKVMVNIDLIRIEQVMNNLVYNAMKNTPKGGIIGLHREIGDKFFIIKVSDTGVGIDEEAINWVFDRFYKGAEPKNQQAGGTGLGLAIAKEIVLKHGGEISVESTRGKGSTFYFSIPFKEEKNMEVFYGL